MLNKVVLIIIPILVVSCGSKLHGKFEGKTTLDREFVSILKIKRNGKFVLRSHSTSDFRIKTCYSGEILKLNDSTFKFNCSDKEFNRIFPSKYFISHKEIFEILNDSIYVLRYSK